MKKIFLLVLVFCAANVQGQTARALIGKDTIALRRDLNKKADSARNNAGVLELRKNGVFVPQFTLPAGGGGGTLQATTDLGASTTNPITLTSTSQYPLIVTPNYGGYGGIKINNLSTSGSSVSRLFLGDGPLNPNRGLDIYELTDYFVSAPSVSVLRTSSQQGMVFAIDSISGNASYYFEFGVPGTGIGYGLIGAWDSLKRQPRWVIGDDGGSILNHKSMLYVKGSTKLNDSLIINDAGYKYAIIQAGNYQDNTGYVEGVGFKFLGKVAGNNSYEAFSIDSTGALRDPFYPNTRNDGYTTKALYSSNPNGDIRYGSLFDVRTQTQNNGQVLFWNLSIGVPSSSPNMKWDTILNKLIVKEMQVIDTLILEDKGYGYANIRTANYLNSNSYVEGVGYNFHTISATNQNLISFRIDSTGVIKIPVTPNSNTAGSPFMVRNTTGGAIETIPSSTLAANSSGAIGMGNASPAASAILDITSTTKGFLPPRMTATQASAIASPAEGLIIYVTNTSGTFTTKGWWGWNGAAFEKLNN